MKELGKSAACALIATLFLPQANDFFGRDLSWIFPPSVAAKRANDHQGSQNCNAHTATLVVMAQSYYTFRGSTTDGLGTRTFYSI
eukprot:COSAG02_NODE_947_length_15716_cov_7.567971_1_plen_85_part_00